MVPGPSRGGAGGEGEETGGSVNETHLVAAGPPGCEPGGLPWRCGLPGVASAAVQALRRLTGDNLVPGPDSDGEGAGPTAQDGLRAVIERLTGWDDATPTDPDEGVREEVAWQLVQQLGARIVPRQRNSRTMQGFLKIFIIASTDISSFGKNSLRNTMGAPKTASAGERPVSSLGCARSLRITKGNSSD
jgi:hypothetical protein